MTDWFSTSWDRRSAQFDEEFRKNRVKFERAGPSISFLLAKVQTGAEAVGKFLISLVWGVLKGILALLRSVVLLIPNLISATIDLIKDSRIFMSNATYRGNRINDEKTRQCCALKAVEGLEPDDDLLVMIEGDVKKQEAGVNDDMNPLLGGGLSLDEAAADTAADYICEQKGVCAGDPQ